MYIKVSFWQPNHLTVSASYKCIGLTYILSIPKPVPDWNTSTHRGPEAFQCDHWKWVEKPIRSSSQYQSLQDPFILHVAATHAKKDMLASLSCSHSQCFCATYWSPLFIFKHDGALCMASKQYPEHHQQLSVAVLYRLFKWQLHSHIFYCECQQWSVTIRVQLSAATIHLLAACSGMVQNGQTRWQMEFFSLKAVNIQNEKNYSLCSQNR